MVATEPQTGPISAGAINALLAGRPSRALARLTEAAPPGSAPPARGAARADRVELSPEARSPARRSAADPSAGPEPEATDDPAAPATPSGEPLTGNQQRQLQQMKKRDAEVRAHEQAHVAAAGALFRGGPTYQTEKGPDGNDYAVAGSVSIDSDPVPGDPEATIAKMQQVRRAALAPADPSTTDRRVAAQASRAEAQARQELAEQRAAEKAEQQAEQPSAQQQGGAADARDDSNAIYTATGAARSTGFPRLLDLAA